MTSGWIDEASAYLYCEDPTALLFSFPKLLIYRAPPFPSGFHFLYRASDAHNKVTNVYDYELVLRRFA